MKHYPYFRANSPAINKKYSPLYPTDQGLYLIHGHVHDAKQMGQNEINVTVDVNDFYPISESEIYKIIKAQ